MPYYDTSVWTWSVSYMWLCYCSCGWIALYQIQKAEDDILQCRAAMLGYVILAYVQYNQELRNAAGIMYSRMQQQGGIGL